MRSVISVFLICNIFILAIVPSDLKKLPMLLQHYNHHRFEEGEKNLSFSEFLVLHYNEHSKHKSNEDHSELPMFKGCNCNDYYAVEQMNMQSSDMLDLVFVHTYYLVKQYNNNNHYSVFQPPRCS